MHEILWVCFQIDGHSPHEQGVCREPEKPYEIYASKRPEDVHCVGPLLDVNRDLWVVSMPRDPRDVVVSRHPKYPDKYFYTLGRWRRASQAGLELREHPRVVTVRYEALVGTPAQVDELLTSKLTFLKKRPGIGALASFHETAEPSKRSKRAMGGLRPLSSKSVGAWRNHKPRLLAQLQIHGSITQELIDLGYETDDSWLKEFDEVTADNQQSKKSDRPDRLSRRLHHWIRDRRNLLAYRRRYQRG